MANTPLMPKATAVWLVDNTSLTFGQIADFCGLHVLEVKGIADGEVSGGIKGMDPIASGQLTRKEIDKGQEKTIYRMKLLVSSVKEVSRPGAKKRRGPRYTPVSRRQDRPNAILWLLQFHPELTENEIVKLVGTTKNTIQTIATGKHWNSKSLEPIDPVTLALCTQMNLDKAVLKAGKRLQKEREAAGIDLDAPVETLLPISQTVKGDVIDPAHLADSWMKDNTPSKPKEKEVTAADVFGSAEEDADKVEDTIKADERAEVKAALSAFDKLDDKGKVVDNKAIADAKQKMMAEAQAKAQAKIKEDAQNKPKLEEPADEAAPEPEPADAEGAEEPVAAKEPAEEDAAEAEKEEPVDEAVPAPVTVEESTDAEGAEPVAAQETEDKNASYKENTEAVVSGHNPDVVDGIVRYLGIALRAGKDAATVACSDKSELDNIKVKFLVKKLALELSEEEQDAACLEVCEKMGTSNRSKCRVAFYYLLAEKFDKLEMFIK